MSITRGPSCERLRNHDVAIANSAAVRAGGSELSADQPYSAPIGHAIRRLVQQDRATARSLSVHCTVWVFFRFGPQRSEKKAFPKHVRLLHRRTQGRQK